MYVEIGPLMPLSVATLRNIVSFKSPAGKRVNVGAIIGLTGAAAGDDAVPNVAIDCAFMLPMLIGTGAPIDSPYGDCDANTRIHCTFDINFVDKKNKRN